jgi:hypothetical protein
MRKNCVESENELLKEYNLICGCSPHTVTYGIKNIVDKKFHIKSIILMVKYYFNFFKVLDTVTEFTHKIVELISDEIFDLLCANLNTKQIVILKESKEYIRKVKKLKMLN